MPCILKTKDNYDKINDLLSDMIQTGKEYHNFKYYTTLDNAFRITTVFCFYFHNQRDARRFKRKFNTLHFYKQHSDYFLPKIYITKINVKARKRKLKKNIKVLPQKSVIKMTGI